jgi:hypothetical protein
MRPQKKEPDCHTKALLDALARWEQHRKGVNIFIVNRLDIGRLVDAAYNFYKGKYPTLASRAMSQVTFGDRGETEGKGFVIYYHTPGQLRDGAMLKGFIGHVTVLPDSMIGHELSHGEQQMVEEIIAITNARYGA